MSTSWHYLRIQSYSLNDSSWNSSNINRMQWLIYFLRTTVPAGSVSRSSTFQIFWNHKPHIMVALLASVSTWLFPVTPAGPGQYLHKSFWRWMSNGDAFHLLPAWASYSTFHFLLQADWICEEEEDHFYLALFSAFDQTHCVSVACDSKWVTVSFLQHVLNIHQSSVRTALFGCYVCGWWHVWSDCQCCHLRQSRFWVIASTSSGKLEVETV